MPLRLFITAFVLSLLTAVAMTWPETGRAAESSDGPLIILLVRHSEKGAGENPSLSAAGDARNRALAETLRGVNLTGVFSTETCRTALTVLPFAQELGLPLHIQGDAGTVGNLTSCTPEVSVETIKFPWGANALIKRLRDFPGPGPVLVAGHSNTLPFLLRKLGVSCATGLCDKLAEHDYDNLFVIAMDRSAGAGSPQASAFRLKYGN